MAFVSFGNGLGVPLYPWWGMVGAASTTSSLANAVNDGFEMAGRICMPGGPGTSKTISGAGGGKIHWHTSTTSTFINVGSTIRVGLQDPTAGGIGDGTFDVFADLVGGGGGIANGGRNTTTMTTGSKTLTWGDSVVVVMQFTTFAGADLFRTTYNTMAALSAPYVALNTTGTPNKTGNPPFCLIEFDDGTIGYFELGYPILETAVSFNSGSTPDEYALIFQLPFAAQVTALLAALGDIDAGETGEIILYSDPLGAPVAEVTLQLGQGEIGQESVTTSSGIAQLVTAFDLDANTDYAVAYRPTSAGNRTIGLIDLPIAAARGVFPFGTSMQGGSRTDQTGAFGSLSTTTMLRAGVMIGAIDISPVVSIDGVSMARVFTGA